MLLYHSEAESKVLGLKVARSAGFMEEWQPAELLSEITGGEYDLCRLKIKGNNEHLFNKLDELGIQYRVFAINYHNRLDVAAPDTPRDETITCEEYDVAKHPPLKDFLRPILQTRGWPEYQSSLYRKLIKPEDEQELALDYFSSFIPEGRPTGHTWLLKANGEYAGAFMGEIEGDTFFGSLYGINPDLRAKGLSKAIYWHMNRICHNMGLKYFRNDVSIFNIPSQRSTASSGLVPTEIYLNVILYPLFSRSVQPKQVQDLTENTLPFRQSLAQQPTPVGYRLASFQSTLVNSEGLPTKAVVTFPIYDENTIITLARVYDKDYKLLEFYYLTFKK